MNDVGYGAVMLDEIHIDRGEFGKLVIQIADKCNCFQENFREYYR